MGTGIDILKISRVKKLVENEKFLSKIFSQKEIEYFKTRNFNISTVAGNFCAKEAFSKAIGTGVRNFSLNEISVLRDGLGKPYYEFSDNVKNILKLKSIENVEVTISHEKDYAISYAYTKTDSNYDKFLAASAKSRVDDEDIINFDMVKNILPKRSINSHKGTYGKLFAIAGSTGLTGAARLCCEAALKCGSGLITLGCPMSLNKVFEICLKEVMTYPLDDENGVLSKKCEYKIFEKIKTSDVVLFGCGLSKNEDIKYLLEKIIYDCDLPIVIDADGINVLAENINVLINHRQKIVLTPHIAEFARLVDKDIDFVLQNGDELANEFAKKYDVSLVLKSHNTKIFLSDGRVYKNVLGNPGMATGGTGDVLAGVIASFVGQKIDFVNSVVLGVYVHSLAADMAAFEYGEYSLTPTDIINHIAYVLKCLGG